MERTPEEIMKGMECCITDNCKGCPYYPLYEVFGCKLARAKDAIALIHQLEAQVPRWISVEERLPKRYEHVLVTTRFTDEGEPYFEIAYFALRGWEKEEGILYGKVTHWMPLPEPPEE
jgi:hypothetical protein